MDVRLKITWASLTLGLLGGCSQAGLPRALPDLSAYQWKHRVLLIDTPTTATSAHQASLVALAQVEPGMHERDLVLVTQVGAPIFRVRLVGKDGGVKLDSGEPVDPAAIFGLIDQMPMRRAEVKSQPTK